MTEKLFYLIQLHQDGKISDTALSNALEALNPQRTAPTPAPRRAAPTPAPRRAAPTPAPRRAAPTPAPRPAPTPAPRRAAPTPAPRRAAHAPDATSIPVPRPSTLMRKLKSDLLELATQHNITHWNSKNLQQLRKVDLKDAILSRIAEENEELTRAENASPTPPPRLTFKPSEYTIRGYLRNWEMNPPEGHVDLINFFHLGRPKIRHKLKEELKDLTNIKAQLAIKIQLRKEKQDGSEDLVNPILRSTQMVITKPSEIDEALDTAFSQIQECLEKWTHKGSGWVVVQIETLWLNIARYQPLRGGSYLDLPNYIKNKKAIINVKNKDDHCLRWALRSALFPVPHGKNPDRPTSYPQEDGLDFTGVGAPTPVSQVEQVEKQNNLAINVFGWDKKRLIIYHMSKQSVGLDRINLLLFSRVEVWHYTWIKNLNRLLYDQSKHCGRKHFCERCLHGYSREDLLEAHKPECMGVGQRAVRIEMPEEGKNKLSFRNWHKQQPAPYIIYADFEALTTKIEGPEPNPTQSNTHKTQLHQACGYGYIIVRCDGESTPPVVYRGPHAAERFLVALQEEETKINKLFQNPKPMTMTPEDKFKHNSATHCHVCERHLAVWDQENKQYKKDSVRDHCHITGKYRGAAHKACNLKLRLEPGKTPIPVVFHNLRGYDSHLIMQAISKVKGQMKCIPNNMEKYISFSLGQLRFIDSAQFLLTSLHRLVASNNPEVFHITAHYETDPQKRQLLLRKGVYPYEYMSSWNRFEETCLPPREVYYSKLTDETITEEDYQHAQKVWKIFKCQTMGDYHDLYLRTDVLLLADVFETFRKTCMVQYGLDPAHYYTSPGLSWDALLKKTGICLELLTDYDMHLFIEKGLRGGISMVSKRYAKANNPRVSGYNPAKPNTHILYLDANNLYGWAMSQALPTGGFKWVKDLQSLEKKIASTTADAKKGYILEVDLEYPHELHDAHNAYPLAPENRKVPKEWLSEYQQQLLGTSVVVDKLVPNLCHKKKYVVHYRNLQLYMDLGMKLTKIHRALQFDQSAWMEPYIQLNTELRKKATTDFEKDLYKLMNNSVFGKTMENLRKRVNVQLVCSSEEDRLRKLIASPAFARHQIFDNDLVALHMYKSKLKLNRPVYVGMSILDLSKHLMYDFYYNKLKTQDAHHCNLLYTDTDSLLLEIHTEDVYADMASHAELYDTSNYPTDHPSHSTTNKKVPGKMKDECAGIPIAEYVGLRPKMYSILREDSEQIRKAKGVKKYVVKKHIRHDQYKESLFNNKTFRHGMNMLRSEGHHIYGLRVNKISLCPLDTKRWMGHQDVNTLALGHKDLYTVCGTHTQHGVGQGFPLVGLT